MAEREAQSDALEQEIEALIAAPLRATFGTAWRWSAAAAGLLTLLLLGALGWTAARGIGSWSNNIPFVWGFDLANYGWWIGIANGAALFACLLVLWRAPLRLAINRLAETLALAAAICAAIFPVIHLGRPWLAWWMVPFPSNTGLWPQPMSALTWDFWAILAYLVTIALFWYVGLIPDLALLRDRAKSRRTARLYGLFALGWQGSGRQWALQLRIHRLLAISVIPFLFAMQTIVALELSTTIVPDWHDTGLPVRFVIAGFASGLGVVYGFGALVQWRFDLPGEDREQLDRLGLIVLATVLVSAFVVALTTLIEWLDPDGGDAFRHWITGEDAWLSWTSLLLGKLLPQLLWFRSVRRNTVAALAIGAGLAIGVWFDHLAVLVLGIAGDRLFGDVAYWPSLVEALILVGSIGLFALLALLFIRLLPAVSIYETRISGEELLA